jgi:hypothetical protein
VVVTWPAAFVVPLVELSGPHAPATLGVCEKLTPSPTTGLPSESLTVAVTVDVLVPSA